MFKVYEMKQTIPQDLPTHWNIRHEETLTVVLSVWTSRSDADKICNFMNSSEFHYA